MRTTITLGDRLAQRLKELATKSGLTVSRLIEDAVRVALDRPPEAEKEQRQFELVTFAAGGRFSRYNVDKTAGLIAADDVERYGKREPQGVQLPDVNALISAHREDAPEHEAYARWLLALVDGPKPFGLAEVVLSGFLRMVTNPRIFDPATPMETALDFCENLVEWPSSVLVLPSHRRWDLFVALCRGENVKGPRVSDAHLAALRSSTAASS